MSKLHSRNSPIPDIQVTQPPACVFESIMTHLRGMRFGSLEITIHEGRIVQIERREKQRLNLEIEE